MGGGRCLGDMEGRVTLFCNDEKEGGRVRVVCCLMTPGLSKEIQCHV